MGESETLAPRERIVLPLDVPDLASAAKWVNLLHGQVGVFKVGLQLFTSAGPDAVKLVHDAGAQCFLDLKLHDIPATVSHAVASAIGLGVEYLTVHAANGRAALSQASEVARGSQLKLLAVTVLTSLDTLSLEEIGATEDPATLVLRRSALAIDSGITGLVCSPMECRAIRAAHGNEPVLVVPGVRPAGSNPGDQRRIATPAQAVQYGADLLVIGRPIRQASDPVAVTASIANEIREATP